METKFIKVFVKFAVAVSIIAALLLIALGIVILLFPELFVKFLLYIAGTICLLIGIYTLGSIIFAVSK